MKHKTMLKKAKAISNPFKVTKGKGFRLRDYDPEGTLGLKHADKDWAKEMLAEGVKAMAELQEIMYAHDRWSLLLIFQAMDAAGKDSAIKHVMSGVNPQGCQVYSFKAPSEEELDHNFLWRCSRRLPRRGNIGIFNRSYYEEVLVVRVHPEILDKQKLPCERVTRRIWQERYEDIASFERHLGRNGVIVRKFFLNVSPGEQKKRFLERLTRPEKHWKFSAADLAERALWDKYMEAYEEAIRHTATEEAPWYVVPADHKWFTRIVVASAIIETLAELKLAYPEVDQARLQALAAAEKKLRREK